MGAARDSWARAIEATWPSKRSPSRDRSRLVLRPPAVRGRKIKSWSDHGRRIVPLRGRLALVRSAR